MEWMALMLLACSVVSCLLGLLLLAVVDLIACLPLWSKRPRRKPDSSSPESESGRV